MHITLNLTSEKENFIRLPRANLHMFQSLLYKIMPAETASFLHDEGYSSGEKMLKLFAMSWPESAERPEFIPDAILFPLPLTLTISTPIAETMSAIVHGAVIERKLRIGNNYMKCSSVVVKQYFADRESITVKTLSPVTCYRRIMLEKRPYTEYFSPDMPEFEEFINRNLRSKFRALYQTDDAPKDKVHVTPLGDIYERAAMHKPEARVPVKGWSGRFQLEGPRELLQAALDCGLGAKNSSGWGCIVPQE